MSWIWKPRKLEFVNSKKSSRILSIQLSCKNGKARCLNNEVQLQHINDFNKLTESEIVELCRDNEIVCILRGNRHWKLDVQTPVESGVRTLSSLEVFRCTINSFVVKLRHFKQHFASSLEQNFFTGRLLIVRFVFVCISFLL